MRRHIPSGPRARLVVRSLIAVALVGGCGDDGDSADVGAPTTEPPPVTTEPVTTADDRPDQPEDSSIPPVTDDEVEPPDGPGVPDPSTLPELVAPAGLGAAQLPGDVDGVISLFEALPVDLLGATREIDDADPATIAARYDDGRRRCSEIGVQAIDLDRTNGELYPDDWRAEHLVALFASGADWEIEQAAREGSLYWVTFETYCGGEDMEQDEIISAAVWGERGSSWIFSVGAADAGGRDLLMGAFAEAARPD